MGRKVVLSARARLVMAAGRTVREVDIKDVGEIDKVRPVQTLLYPF